MTQYQKTSQGNEIKQKLGHIIRRTLRLNYRTFNIKFNSDTAFDFTVGLALINSRVIVANFSYYQGPDAVFFHGLQEWQIAELREEMCL